MNNLVLDRLKGQCFELRVFVLVMMFIFEKNFCEYDFLDFIGCMIKI